MIGDMETNVKTFPRHACQYCGHDRKLVDAILSDMFVWNETLGVYEPHMLTNDFEHTGDEWCERCGKEWTGF
jgi:hypothetical protein